MKPLFFLLIVLVQQDVPFKPSEDFEVTLDYQFKPYIETERKAIDHSEHRRAGLSLLYLVAQVKIKTVAPDEVRVNVTNNLENSVRSRKAERDMVLKIDFKFIEDVKERVTAHEFNIFMVSPDRKRVSRIHLFIEKDGTFLVNGQKRGKF